MCVCVCVYLRLKQNPWIPLHGNSLCGGDGGRKKKKLFSDYKNKQTCLDSSWDGAQHQESLSVSPECQMKAHPCLNTLADMRFIPPHYGRSQHLLSNSWRYHATRHALLNLTLSCEEFTAPRNYRTESLSFQSLACTHLQFFELPACYIR